MPGVSDIALVLDVDLLQVARILLLEIPEQEFYSELLPALYVGV